MQLSKALTFPLCCRFILLRAEFETNRVHWTHNICSKSALWRWISYGNFRSHLPMVEWAVSKEEWFKYMNERKMTN